MADGIMKTWFRREKRDGIPVNVSILKERADQRGLVLAALKDTLLDHFVGLDIIQSIGGFSKAANVIRNALPKDKKTRSGDFGEMLATEYAEQVLNYTVPIRKLRYKEDRELAMRGDDLLGFLFSERPPKILKTEAKSRITLSKTVVEEAGKGLKRHHGRPNPSTLSFISRRLREMKKHDQAEIVEQIQKGDINHKTIAHLIFTLSGNDPADYLKEETKSSHPEITRLLAGCVIADHAEFIAGVFDLATQTKGGKPRGNH